MRISNTLLFSAAPLANAALGFLIVPLMTWTLPEAGVAKFGLFQYSTSLALIFVTLGLDQSFLRELPTCSAPSSLLTKCLLLSAPMVIGAILLAWGMFISGTAERLFGPDSALFLLLLVVNVALQMILRFGTQETRLSDRGGGAFLLAEVLQRFPLVILLTLAATLALQIDENKVFLALIIGVAFAMTVHIVFNKKTWLNLGTNTRDHAGRSSVQLIRFGIPLALDAVLYWGIASIGTYAIQWFYGPEAAAKLIVATSLANLAVVGQSIFALLWTPYVYKKLNRGLSPLDIENAARKTCVGAAGLLIIVVLAIHAVQYILGPKYREIAHLATPLCVLPALYSVAMVTYVGLLEKHRSGLTLVATILAFLICVLANIGLIPLLGVAGASIATALSSLAFLFFRTEFACSGWQSFRRGRIYFGAVSIAATGVVAPLIPSSASLSSLLLLMPYLYFERRAAFALLNTLAKNIRHKNLLGW